jgi:hypothetical protein
VKGNHRARALRNQAFAALVILIATIVAGCAATAPTPTSVGATLVPAAVTTPTAPALTEAPNPTLDVTPTLTPPAGPTRPASSTIAPKVAVGPSAKPSAKPTPAATPGASVRLPGEPNRTMTPGATNPAVTQATIGSTICVSGWTATIRPPSSYTTALKRTQIVAYRYTDTNLADYEEDHLISLEIGGAPRDPANLWPEPYTISLPDGTAVGARVKDQLENRLKSLVCSRSMTLATAQRLIATDWIAAWRTYVVGGSTPASGPVATAKPAATPHPTTPPVTGAVTVAITSLTSPISRGSTATVGAKTAAGAACTVVVQYKSGPSSAAGLSPKNASASGTVSWSWTVGSRTTPGSWPVTVRCASGGTSASATTSLVVQ